jgi:Glycogen recognition site of AMP-activated protein kinase
MAQTDPLEQLIVETRAFVDARPVPDFVNVVMGEVEHLEADRAKTPRSWIARTGQLLWTPRLVTFAFRPAYTLVAAASVLLLTVVLSNQWSTADRLSSTVATQGSEKVYVQFRLQTSEANDVRLAGSFTHWQPQYQLHETAPGLWTVTLPLAPGVHDYAFIIDGQRWVTDPYAAAVQDGFGGSNSRITLVAGSDRRL